MDMKIIIKMCFWGGLQFSMPISAQTPVQTPLTYEMLLPDFQKNKPVPMELGTYGAYETSEYTGTLDISIPLYEANSGNVSLPISLKYDATGVKVSQQASTVGLSWQLHLGGSITHVVNGQDDFTSIPTLTDKEFLDSLYMIAKGYHASYIPQDYVIDWDLGLGIANVNQLYQYSSKMYWRSLLMADVSHGMHTPDVFHASFCGRDISFTLDKKTGQVTILDDNACKYRVNVELGSPWPKSISIIDDRGFTYFFRPFCEYDQLDCFYLTEIKGANPNDIITISYAQHTQEGQYELYQSMGQLESISGGGAADLSSFLGVHSLPVNSNVYKNVVYPIGIETLQEKVLLEYADREDITGAKSLKDILVISKNGNVQIHKIVFSYGYFMELSRGEGKSTALLGAKENGNYSAKRLKLSKVLIDDKKYAFSYNEEVALPYVTSLSQDYWGYYNGVNNQDNFCSSPLYQVSGNSLMEICQLGNANRLASPRNVQCGMLRKIEYPTGGYSVFEFESHHFDDTYYYPRAEHPICKTATKVSVSSVAAQKDKPGGKSFSLSEDQDIEFSVNLNSKDPQNHPCSATIWCAHGNNYKEVFSTSVSTPGMSRTFTRHLKAGVYVIYVSVPYVVSDYTTAASISATTGYTYRKDLDSYDASGASVGGGVRIKSITNYDGRNSDFVDKTIYEYSGGKLLVPTVRRKELALHYSSNSGKNLYTINYSFVGSQKSDMALMSMGVPTIGYSSVIKKNVNFDEDNNGYIKFDFENIPYRELGVGELYYYPNFGLNGKITKQSVYSAGDELVKEVQYVYGTKKYSEVLFPKCTPLFLDGVSIEGCRYRLSIYPKANVWNYLEKVQETNYILGKPMHPKTINYVYKDDNYKECQVVVQDGTGMQIKKNLYYSVDEQSLGADKLMKHNALSEVTEMSEYRGKEKLQLVGGFHKDYASLSNGQVVACNFFSKNTDGTRHQEMAVVRRDAYGNILEYVKSSGEHVVLLWSYSYQYPVLEVVGATYDEIKVLSPLVSQLGSKSTLTEQEIKSLHTLISGKINGYVTAYLYNSWYKISEMIFPNGNIYYYNYDAYGRLVSEKGIDDNPLYNYKYNYRQ